MASNHASLDAAATERKARLAKLNSLKRKQPEPDPDPESTAEPQADGLPSVTETYLSGRNYDPGTRGPKLGFENAPTENQETLENRAQEIANAASKAAADDEKADKPIDLFKLQPKKPNWDLKRDLDRKLERLNVQTDNAIARLVRERLQAQKKTQQVEKAEGVEGTGLKGEELVEAMHVKEREGAEEERREREEEEDEYSS